MAEDDDRHGGSRIVKVLDRANFTHLPQTP